MKNDEIVVVELRSWINEVRMDDNFELADLLEEAAGEIERLRAEVKLLRKREIGGAAVARRLPPVLRTQLREAIQNLSPVGRPEEATDGRG